MSSPSSTPASPGQPPASRQAHRPVPSCTSRTVDPALQYGPACCTHLPAFALPAFAQLADAPERTPETARLARAVVLVPHDLTDGLPPGRGIASTPLLLLRMKHTLLRAAGSELACTQREYGPPGHGVASESDGESTSSRTSLRFYSQPLRLTLEAQPKGCHSIASTRSRCGSHSKPHALPASHRPLDHTASCPHPMKAKKEDHIASAGKAKKEFSASRYVQHLRLYSIARSAMSGTICLGIFACPR